MALRTVVWAASARAELRGLPKEVRTKLGRALYLVQLGDVPQNVKRLHGSLRDVHEIIETSSSGTFRLAFAWIGDVVYGLYAFKKKSRSGISTPQEDLELIARRYRKARKDHFEKAGGRW